MEEKTKYILERVSSLFLKYGIRSVTMDDVSREAGISKKTLYQFFKDKEDLVEQTISLFMCQNLYLKAKSESINAIDSLITLRNHVAQIMKHYNNNLEFELKKYYPSQYEKLKTHKRNDIYEGTLDNINQGIYEGFYRKGIDVEFVAKLQVGRMLCTMNPDTGIFDEREIMSLEIFDKAIEYHLRAICTEKGLNYFLKQINKIKYEKNN